MPPLVPGGVTLSRVWIFPTVTGVDTADTVRRLVNVKLFLPDDDRHHLSTCIHWHTQNKGPFVAEAGD